MGVLTDFFIASPVDISRVLGGWQLPPPPLPEPRTVQGINPFTKEPVTIKTRQDASKMPEPDEDADPSPSMESLPNVQCKGLLPDKLAIVYSSLTGIDVDDAMSLITRGGLVGPLETEVLVERMPDDFTEALAAATDDDLAEAAEAVEDDEAENFGESARGFADDLADVLGDVRALARRCRSSEADLFVWMSP